jgi:hypothetical protein
MASATCPNRDSLGREMYPLRICEAQSQSPPEEIVRKRHRDLIIARRKR